MLKPAEADGNSEAKKDVQGESEDLTEDSPAIRTSKPAVESYDVVIPDTVRGEVI